MTEAGTYTNTFSQQAIPLADAERGAGFDYDLKLLVCAFTLLCLGLVMVASSSISVAEQRFHDPLHYFWRQSAAAAVGVIMAYCVVQLPLVYWQRLSRLLLVAAIVLLALVLIPGLGKEVNGSIRWVKLGPISMQASEPAKLCVIIYLAGYLVHFHEEVRNTLIGFLRPVVVLIIIAGLLLLEPDFGSTAVIFATTLGMLFLGGVSFTRFAIWGGLALTGLAGVAVMAPYRVKRLLNFRNPWDDQFDSGFQLVQALIAIGRGEWLGVGLGSSVLKMFYLPEAHTDFIFAVIAEEFGLAGSLALVLMFGYLVLRALQIGGRAEEAGQLFGAYLAYGIGLWLGIQAFVNFGVNMGVLPTKGLTLPFISYGGNSLVVTCVALALLLRAEHESRYRCFNPYTHGGPRARTRGGPSTYGRR